MQALICFINSCFAGEKLVENINKYVITELPLNEYSLMMNLTIKSLEKRDFGGYLCTSSNALGRVEAGVRLQGESRFSCSYTLVISVVYIANSLKVVPIYEEKTFSSLLKEKFAFWVVLF
jgi:hypothetical protein